MKRIKSFIIISILCFGIIGCSNENNEKEVVPTPITINSTSIPTLILESKENSNTITPTPTTSIFSPTKNEASVVTEGLCEVLEEREISSAKNYNAFHRMLSVYMETSGSSSFCIEEETGVIYFVNQGKDYYLYRLKDGEVKLAVAMPVKEIYTYDGRVYFMIDDYKKYELNGIHNGDIYCYTLENGTVELVYSLKEVENAQYHRLMVEAEGIYFSYCTYENQYHYYSLPFGETKPVEDTKRMTEKGWNDYVFETIDGEFCLVHRTEKTDIIKVPRGYMYCVVEDILYYVEMESSILKGFDLKTKETIEYDFWPLVQLEYESKDAISEGLVVLSSFVITKTDIWAKHGMWLYRFNLQSEEWSRARLGREKSGYYTIGNLYTDGEQLYATCSTQNGIPKTSTFSFVRVLTEQVEADVLGDPIMKVQYLIP